jgi:hypothetical protein
VFPLQSIENLNGYHNSVPSSDIPLMALTWPSKDSECKLVLYWLSTPSLAFCRADNFPIDLWGFDSQSYDHRGGQTFLIFYAPLEFDHKDPVGFIANWLSWGLHSLQCNYGLSPLTLNLPRLVRSAFRFSQPISGLLLQPLRGFISYPLHSWDLPFRVFPSGAASPSFRIRLP